MTLTSYQYKILRYIHHRKKCPLKKLTRKFGRGITATLEELDKYLDYTATVSAGDGYISIGTGDSYALSDDGYAAVEEYHYTMHLKTWETILISTVSAIIGALVTYFFPLITQFLKQFL